MVVVGLNWVRHAVCTSADIHVDCVCLTISDAVIGEKCTETSAGRQ